MSYFTFRCVIDAKVGRPVDNDALHGHAESLVQALYAVRLRDLHQAVTQAFELPGGPGLAHVGSQAGTGEVKRVDEAEGGRSGSSSGRQVTGEVPPELCVFVYATKENILVLILEGEVEGLSRKVAYDIGHITAPERGKALLFGDTHDTVHNSFVLHVGGDL